MKTKYKSLVLVVAMLMSLTSLTTYAHATNTTATASGDIDITKSFPDVVFRQYIIDNFDLGPNPDGFLTQAEIDDVKEIVVNNMGITSLEGIQYFTKLTKLDCELADLTTLDVSQNTALTKLNCASNSLSTLDVSQNMALTELKCYRNNLTILDVSQNTALTKLDCSNNSLSTLDVSRNMALTELVCGNRQLATLDVSQNTALTTLDCSYSQLTTLDISQNRALKNLFCFSNYLTTLDLTHNVKLLSVFADENNLISLHLLSSPSFVYIADQNVRTIAINSKGEFNFKALDEKFDVNKMSDLKINDLPRESLTNEILNGLSLNTVIKYKYKLSNGGTLDAQLQVANGYQVNVYNGTSLAQDYMENDTVTIKANDPAIGKMFKEWKADSNNVTFADKNNSKTTFTMPVANVDVTAIYEDMSITSLDSKYQIESGKNLIFNCEEDAAHFTGVYVDGNLLDADHYLLSTGKTVVTLQPSYLDTLTVGEHILKFMYKGNVGIETKFTVIEKAVVEKPKPGEITPPPIVETPIPPEESEGAIKTNDTTNIGVYLTLIVVFGCVGGYALRKKKVNK